MSDTLVDANILIDILEPDPRWHSWSNRQLKRAKGDGRLIINPIIYAEVSGFFPTQSDLDAALPPNRYEREDLPWEAAFNAGRAFVAYRRSGGSRRAPIPDFYIAAHADVRGYRLLTRDRGYYATYFPMLRLISPDTHP